MPVMDGVTATEYIMANCPTPILMVSASSNRGQALQTFDALAAGAIDVLDKAAGIEPDGVWERELVAAVKMVSRIRPIRRSSVNRRSRITGAASGELKTISIPAHESDEAVIVAIGASIGGPSAVAKILSQIPADFPLSILLVIHIEPEFSTVWFNGSQSCPTSKCESQSMESRSRDRAVARYLCHRRTVT